MGFNKDEAVKKIQDSDATEFEVFDKTEHETYIENYRKSTVDRELKSKVKSIHDKYDDDIYQLTGRRRGENEKTFDLLNEVMGDYKDRDQQKQKLEAEIASLNQMIKDGNGNSSLKTKLEAAESELANVQKLHKDEKDLWLKEKKTITTSHQKANMSNILDRSRLGIKFKEGMTDNVIKVVVDAVTSELLEIAEVIEGKMVFKDKEGAILRNKDTLNPFTPEEMLKSRLKDIIDEGRRIEGTGAGPAIIKDKDGKETVNYIPDATVKTKDDLHKDLVTKGFVRGSKEYKLAWAKYSEEYKQ